LVGALGENTPRPSNETIRRRHEEKGGFDGVFGADPKTAAVIMEMLDACADITEALRSALVTVEGSSNTFGDSQLSVDVVADEIMWVSVFRLSMELEQLE
jgi:fructose-1,6-bisphosphatase